MRRFVKFDFLNRLKDEGTKQILQLNFLISFSLLIILLIFIWRMQPQVPLFYSLARSVQQLAQKYWLFLLPGFSLLISLLHTLIMIFFKHLDQLVLRLFARGTLLIQILLLVILLRILLIIN